MGLVKMIFFCFSSKDRHSIVEALLHHIMNYALPVWYDRQQMLLGDDRDYKNFIEGVEMASYSIIVLSPNSIASVCANEEIELIRQKYVNNNIVVFPLFYNINASDIPEKYLWMKRLVYKEVKNENDIYSACNHIICKVLTDELSKYRLHSFSHYCNECKNIPIQGFVIEMLNKYTVIDNNNYNSKITILYSIYIFIKNSYTLSTIPEYYYSGMDRLFDETRLNLEIDLRETIIFEKMTLLLLNSVLFGYII